MPRLIDVPATVASVAVAALGSRAARQAGGTQRGLVVATALGSGRLTSAELAEVRRWHEHHEDAVQGDACTLLAGLYGGAPAREWLAVRAAARNPDSGAMVALPVEGDAAKTLAHDDGEPVAGLHLTLAHIADIAPEDDAQRARYADVVGAHAATNAPPTVTLTHIERFVADDEGLEPVAAVSDNSGVYAQRADLVESLKAAGLPYSDSHAFRAHVTLGYYAPGDGPDAGPLDEPVTLRPSALALHWGDRHDEYEYAAPALTAASRAEITRRARLRRLSRAVAKIDRALERDIYAAARVSYDEAIRRAGVKLRQKARTVAAKSALEASDGLATPAVLAAAGLEEQTLIAHTLDSLHAKMLSWAPAAIRAKIAVVAKELKPDPDLGERDDDSWTTAALTARYEAEALRRAEIAAGLLIAAVGWYAIRRLTKGAGASDELPYGVIRPVMTVLRTGQQPDVSFTALGEEPPSLQATREWAADSIVDALVAEREPTAFRSGVWVHGYYGDPKEPFDPHVHLDGEPISGPEDEILAKDEEDFPFGSYYWPGDHDFCTCEIDDAYALPEGIAAAGGWNEDDHPRDDHGRFTDAGGGGVPFPAYVGPHPGAAPGLSTLEQRREKYGRTKAEVERKIGELLPNAGGHSSRINLGLGQDVPDGKGGTAFTDATPHQLAVVEAIDEWAQRNPEAAKDIWQVKASDDLMFSGSAAAIEVSDREQMEGVFLEFNPLVIGPGTTVEQMWHGGASSEIDRVVAAQFAANREIDGNTVGERFAYATTLHELSHVAAFHAISTEAGGQPYDTNVLTSSEFDYVKAVTGTDHFSASDAAAVSAYSVEGGVGETLAEASVARALGRDIPAPIAAVLDRIEGQARNPTPQGNRLASVEIGERLGVYAAVSGAIVDALGPGSIPFDWAVGKLGRTAGTRALVAYAEDQPRDEYGRWTSDGGGELGAKAEAQVVAAMGTSPRTRLLSEAEVLDRYGTATQCNAALREWFPNARVTSKIDGPDRRNAETIRAEELIRARATEAFVELAERYPYVADTVDEIHVTGYDYMAQMFGYTAGTNLSADGPEIKIYAEKLAEDILPHTDQVNLGDATWGTAVHEFGHAVENHAIMVESLRSGKALTGLEAGDYLDHLPDEIGKRLYDATYPSKYSEAKPTEHFAEIFAAREMGIPLNRQANEVLDWANERVNQRVQYPGAKYGKAALVGAAEPPPGHWDTLTPDMLAWQWAIRRGETAAFDESQHPRDEHGRFTDAGGAEPNLSVVRSAPNLDAQPDPHIAWRGLVLDHGAHGEVKNPTPREVYDRVQNLDYTSRLFPVQEWADTPKPALEYGKGTNNLSMWWGPMGEPWPDSITTVLLEANGDFTRPSGGTPLFGESSIEPVEINEVWAHVYRTENTIVDEPGKYPLQGSKTTYLYSVDVTGKYEPAHFPGVGEWSYPKPLAGALERVLERARTAAYNEEDHPRDEAGRWTDAGGIGGRVAREGGLTVKPLTGEEPKSGYVVGDPPGREVPAAEFFDDERGPQILREFMDANAEHFDAGGWLGLWHDTAKAEVVLDRVLVIEDRAEAVRLGQANDQQSIWDVVGKHEVDTGGSGARAAAVPSPPPEALVEDDRGREGSLVRARAQGDEGRSAALDRVLARARLAALSPPAITAYSEDQPREPAGSPEGGQWSGGGGGGSGGSGGGWVQAFARDWLGQAGKASERALQVHVDHVGDGRLVANILAQGEKVDLPATEVSVLLDRLHQFTEDAKARGEEAPLYNLCDVTIDGTNLFCADSHDIPRQEMPQLGGIAVEGTPAAEAVGAGNSVDATQPFLDSLRDAGIDFRVANVPAAVLKATQNELDGRKVSGIMSSMEAGTMKAPTNPIFASSENYILDGHHRWAADVGVEYRDGMANDQVRLDVMQVDLPILDLIDRAKKFADEYGVGTKAFGAALQRVLARARLAAYDPDQPRDDQGRWTGGGEMREYTMPSGRKRESNGTDVRDFIATLNPKDAKTLEREVRHWTGASAWLITKQADDMLAGHPTGREESQRGVQLLMQAIDESPPIAPALYRGDRLTVEDAAKMQQVGHEFDQPLASFTWNPDHTVFFNVRPSPGRDEPWIVTYDLKPGAHAVSVSGLSDFRESEWITGGRFRVVGVDAWPSQNPAHPGGNLHVHLEQVGSPSSLARARTAAGWDESEHPRDEKGQFTDKGEVAGNAMAEIFRGGDADAVRSAIEERFPNAKIVDLRNLLKNTTADERAGIGRALGRCAAQYPQVANDLGRVDFNLTMQDVPRAAREMGDTPAAAQFDLEASGRGGLYLNPDSWAADMRYAVSLPEYQTPFAIAEQYSGIQPAGYSTPSERAAEVERYAEGITTHEFGHAVNYHAMAVREGATGYEDGAYFFVRTPGGPEFGDQKSVGRISEMARNGGPPEAYAEAFSALHFGIRVNEVSPEIKAAIRSDLQDARFPIPLDRKIHQPDFAIATRLKSGPDPNADPRTAGLGANAVCGGHFAESIAMIYARGGVTAAYDENQPRDEQGRWTSGGGGDLFKETGRTFLTRSGFESKVGGAPAIAANFAGRAASYKDGGNEGYQNWDEYAFRVTGDLYDRTPPEQWEPHTAPALSEAATEWQSSFDDSREIQAAVDGLLGYGPPETLTDRSIALGSELLSAYIGETPEGAMSGYAAIPDDKEGESMAVEHFSDGELSRGFSDPDGTLEQAFRDARANDTEIAFGLAGFKMAGEKQDDLERWLKESSGDDPATATNPDTGEEYDRQVRAEAVSMGYAVPAPSEGYGGTAAEEGRPILMRATADALVIDGSFEALAGGTFKVTTVRDSTPEERQGWAALIDADRAGNPYMPPHGPVTEAILYGDPPPLVVEVTQTAKPKIPT